MSNHHTTANTQIKPIENRITSLFVHVTDLRRAAEWYSQLLGLQVREERLTSGPVYWFDLPEAHLILDSNTENRKNPEWREEMKPRFMLACSNIDEAYEHTEHKAVTYSKPSHHGSMAYFNFSDLEGNTLMVSRNTASAEANALNPADCVSPILPRIGGVFVDVTDMKSAVQWYTELFNLPYDDKDTDPPIYSIPMTNGPVLLLDQHRSWRQENFTELFYFETDDIEAAYQYVLDQGFKVTGKPNDFEDLAEFAVIDPDGNRIVIACMK
ncbi:MULTISPECIES: VOC family protein [unclassified Paenibacillus]|uniref:VOC family protein n=1 Tax=Paenibacillus provencensis TaxID=441151 RepID=A0ABW3Q202_9BACL|nr:MULTISPECIES: VOC family protein [unclassified Paenibacillus]MCM3130058.1 VOC family protein [Paenibacillus sp. MER 78]SFS62018.1 hypothetical protein SAMN04488601_1012786 [Paenibacillus sp. 453mf]